MKIDVYFSSSTFYIFIVFILSMRDYTQRIIPDREHLPMGNEILLCRYCQQNPPCENIHHIFSILHLSDLIKFLDDNPVECLGTYHPEGYTFIHKLFWTFGRERFAHRNAELALESQKMIFYLVDHYPEIMVSLCKNGLQEDPGNTPLHDYIKNISFIKKEDIAFIDYLRHHNVIPSSSSSHYISSIRDQQGLSFDDYLRFKTLDLTIKKNIQQTQSKLKITEKIFMSDIYKDFESAFEYCSSCKKIINLYRDLDRLDLNSWLNHQRVKTLLFIIKTREKIQEIFNLHSFTDPKRVESHQTVIDIWKRKLFLLSAWQSSHAFTRKNDYQNHFLGHSQK